nr:retrotransposon protein, putative, Ty1-copia subclass [Tanacetum cinerariifolium]
MTLKHGVLYLRSDRGGEYIIQEFKYYLKACGIVQQLTPPYTPQHNDVSRRRNRTLLDMVRSMMNLTTMSLFLWDYALESATSILNIVSTKKVDKTPYELWYGKVLNLSYLKANQHSLGDLNEPTSYKAAMLDLKSNKLLGAMNAEMQFMIDNIVWVLVNLHPNCKTVGNVKTAFLNGYLDEDIYMMQIDGFVDPKNPKKARWTERAPSKVLPQCLPQKLNISASEAAMEAVWIKKFISGLGVQKGAIHYRECIELGEINLLKVHTDDNLDDPFTKALPKEKLTQHARSIRHHLASSFM